MSQEGRPSANADAGSAWLTVLSESSEIGANAGASFEAVAGDSFAPQDMQNVLSGLFMVLHFGQGTACPLATEFMKLALLFASIVSTILLILIH